MAGGNVDQPADTALVFRIGLHLLVASSHTVHEAVNGRVGYLLVMERRRRPGEIDRFQWFCPKCDGFLHEEQFVVHDYTLDPVSKAYANFFELRARADLQEVRSCHAQALSPGPACPTSWPERGAA